MDPYQRMEHDAIKHVAGLETTLSKHPKGYFLNDAKKVREGHNGLTLLIKMNAYVE